MKNYYDKMTYRETTDFLFSQLPAYHRIGKDAYKNNLECTLLLDQYFGCPHMKFRSIHVAGTNGKGSVSHMLASMLQEAGYKTGLFTSPHLKDFRERIRIDGVMISQDEVINFVENHRDILESAKPSFFEMTVAMAFDYFERSRIDIAVIETGLGGRLDSTNIITPELSVITNIGHDHMDILGDTLEKVAHEKAGIIKMNIPVVIGETQIETSEVFRLKAAETGSMITFADKIFTCHFDEGDPARNEKRYQVSDLTGEKSFRGISNLTGNYQSKNLITVSGVWKALKDKMNLSVNNLTDGIANVVSNTGLSGRWQILRTSPLTICDTGHNREGLEYVMAQITSIPNTKLHMIVGFVSDKDLSSILPLFPRQAQYYFTKASVPRALDEKILKEQAAEYNLHGNSFRDIKTAIQSAYENASNDDLIFIGGSTFVVGDALSVL